MGRSQLTEREKLLVDYGILYGKTEMAWALAVWKSGTPCVGVAQRPYKDFVLVYEADKESLRKELNMTDCEILFCEGCDECR